jgi:hypothetical protein
MAETLYKCENSGCRRLVPAHVLYCCSPCAVAADHGHEIDVHSEGCDVMWPQRRPPETFP